MSQKYPDAYELPPHENILVQEITLDNDCGLAWPVDTILKLNDMKSDLKVQLNTLIGKVVNGAQVKIRLRLDFTKSDLSCHEFTYKLCHGQQAKEVIGE